MSNPLVVTAVTILIIVLSAFFVITEFALLGARRYRLEEDARTSRSARAALRAVNELTIMLAVAQLGVTACTFALGAVTKPAVDGWLSPIFASWGLPAWLSGGASFALSLLLVTFLHLVVGEMAPKSWTIAHPETAAKLIGPPSRTLAWVFRPLLTWINDVANRLVAATGVTPVDRAAVGGQDAETIRHLVEHSASVGALDTSYSAPALSDILELDQTVVDDLISAGEAPVTVPIGATVADAQRAAAQTGHLRILVETADAALPHRMHVRDTLLEPDDRPVEEIARPALVLPAQTPIYEALGRMRETSEHLAVISRDDRSVGVVTLTDILTRVMPHPAGATTAETVRDDG